MEITDRERELVELYRKADADDKAIIRCALKKYRCRMWPSGSTKQNIR